MRTLGLIGGLSWESTAIYYRLINEGIRLRLGRTHSAPLVLWSFDFAPIAEAQDQGRWEDIAKALVAAAGRLEGAGAEGVILCTNTMHLVADRIQAEVSIPFLHIADGIVQRARASGINRLGLLGTKFTMEMPFLKDRLASAGLDIIVPDEPDRREVHRIIYDELCTGKILAPSRTTYLRAIAALRDGGAQAVILGCTEIGMLVQQEHVDLPLLDTTLLHLDLAVEFIIGGGE